MELKELLEKLITTDGVERVHVNVEVNPIIRKENTGESDKFHQTIRERTVPEDSISSTVEGTGWRHKGVVDSRGDFAVIDKISKSYNVEPKEE